MIGAFLASSDAGCTQVNAVFQTRKRWFAFSHVKGKRYESESNFVRPKT